MPKSCRSRCSEVGITDRARCRSTGIGPAGNLTEALSPCRDGCSVYAFVAAVVAGGATQGFSTKSARTAPAEGGVGADT